MQKKETSSAVLRQKLMTRGLQEIFERAPVRLADAIREFPELGEMTIDGLLASIDWKTANLFENGDFVTAAPFARTKGNAKAKAGARSKGKKAPRKKAPRKKQLTLSGVKNGKGNGASNGASNGATKTDGEFARRCGIPTIYPVRDGVLTALRSADEPMSLGDLTLAAGYSKQLVRAALQSIEKEGKVSKIGKKRGTKYELVR